MNCSEKNGSFKIFAMKIMAPLESKVEACLNENDNGEAYKKLFIDLSELRQNLNMDAIDVAEFLVKISGKFIEHNDFGRASEIVRAAVDELQKASLLDEAAGVLVAFADELFKRRQYGWAGSRYYGAAAMFIRSAELNKAKNILQNAYERFKDSPDIYWRDLLERHAAIIKPQEQLDECLQQLLKLQAEFREISREDWASACKEGSLKLAAEEVEGN